MASPEWISLPADALRNVFSLLGTSRDLGACANVCRAFRDLAREPGLWRQVAVARYGAAACASEATLRSYGDSWFALVRDDNRNGALPTIHLNRPCYWTLNELVPAGRFYCCFVTQIKWDRVADQVLVYLDARGEHDLRPPGGGSSVRWRSQNGDVQSIVTGRWEGEVEIPGHFKGHLAFDPRLLAEIPPTGGRLRFSYANRFHNMYGDYEAIDFPSWQEISASTEYTPHGSPFANDTDEIEKERWSKLAPASVIERHPNTVRRPGERRPPFTPVWWATTEEPTETIYGPIDRPDRPVTETT